jgi:heme-degrading monooxygenase HmoA
MMFASMRCYYVHKVAAEELIRRVDADFAAQVAAQPGFVSYEFLDCGGGEVMSVSVFETATQAAASRSLARHWTDTELQDLELTVTENLHGPIVITAHAPDAHHVGGDHPHASIRRYRLGRRHAAVLTPAIEKAFPDRIAALDGFLSYRVLDCGDAGMLSLSLFRDAATAAASDELARHIIRDEFTGLAIERTDAVAGGVVMVSRSAQQLRQPIR